MLATTMDVTTMDSNKNGGVSIELHLLKTKHIYTFTVSTSVPNGTR